MASPHGPSPGDPARGNIIPFPAAAIRRPPPVFHTRPALPERTSTPRPLGLGWIVVLALVTVSIAGLALLGTSWLEVQRFSRKIERIPGAFTQPEADRPAKPLATERSVNLLVAGLDGDDRANAERGARSDAIMVLHLDADREKAWLVSIPRDAWVSIPGHGENKANAAYSLGGPALFVQTLEQMTALRFDHLVVIDWTGFRRLTDAMGGVPLSLGAANAATPDSGAAGVALEMSGNMALEYVSARKTLPNGDFDRIRRQQHYLRALLARALERHTLSEPAAVRDVAVALGEAVRVDAGLTTAELMRIVDATRRLGIDDVTFLTAPVSHTGQEGEASVVYCDDVRCAQLWDALAHDEMPAFVAAHPELVTPDEAR